MNQTITCETPIEDFIDYLIENKLSARQNFISFALSNLNKVGDLYQFSEQELLDMKAVGRDYIMKISTIFIINDLENFYATNLYNSIYKRKRHLDRFIIKSILTNEELDGLFDQWINYSESASKYNPQDWPNRALADFIYDVKHSANTHIPSKKVVINGKTLIIKPVKTSKDIWFDNLSRKRQLHTPSQPKSIQKNNITSKSNPQKSQPCISAVQNIKIDFNDRLIHKMQNDIINNLNTEKALPKITLPKSKLEKLSNKQMLIAIKKGIVDIEDLNDPDFIKKYELELFNYTVKNKNLNNREKFDIIKFIQNPESYIK